MVHTDYVYDYLKSETLKISNNQVIENDNTLRVRKYYNCYALPYRNHEENGMPNNAGGLDVEGAILKNSALSGWAVGYPYNKSDALEIPNEVIYIGFICDYCWGHAITDSLEHLWWFRTLEYKEHYANHDIFYWSQKPLSGVFLELLEKAGVPINRLHHVDKLLHFKSALVPDSSVTRISHNQFKYTCEYVKTVEDIINKNTSCLKIDKIFVIRKNESRQYACKTIKKILISRGFKEFVPNEHTLSEQISVFNNASEIVCEESSASHNFIFCKSGTKVTILRKCNHVNEYQAMINSLKNLDVTYIDCHLSVIANDKLPTAGPFFLYANLPFCNAFNVKYAGFPFNEFKKHLNYFLYHQSCNHNFPNVFTWDKNYVSIFTKDLEFYRHKLEKMISVINYIPFVNDNFKKRIETALLKRIFRIM